MRKNLVFIVMAILFSGCSLGPDGKDKPDPFFMEGVDTTPVVDMHTSRIALDYQGTYRGILPCGDCDGIETTIYISYDKTFEKTLKHLGADKEVVLHSEGRYVWEESGGIIRLKGDYGFTRYMVAENFLVHFEDDGESFQGDLGEHYVLQKVSD